MTQNIRLHGQSCKIVRDDSSYGQQESGSFVQNINPMFAPGEQLRPWKETDNTILIDR